LEKGHVFRSETDSEVIVHLIEEEMKGKCFVEAFNKAIGKLEGSYAIVALHEGDRRILGARKESPLVVGISKDGNFISSDVTSFLDETKKVIYLYDGDVVILDIQDVDETTLVTITYKGACMGCSSALTGTLSFIEQGLQDKVDKSIRVSVK
jgi:glucosamine--fructose-6-phosphate aminotransferase (isomerizing)